MFFDEKNYQYFNFQYLIYIKKEKDQIIFYGFIWF